jgi:hypothetical protein
LFCNSVLLSHFFGTENHFDVALLLTTLPGTNRYRRDRYPSISGYLLCHWSSWRSSDYVICR